MRGVHRRVFGVVAAAGLIAAGCTSSDSSSDATSAATSTTSSGTGETAAAMVPTTLSTDPLTSVGQSSEPPSPPGDFYSPPDPLPEADPGTLIWAERVDLELDPPATIWRILYHSRNEDGDDIAVSGFAVVPDTPAADGRDVYAWAHGTVGMGDQCAPSRAVRDNLPPFGGQQVERGTVLVATDYAGLGVPGVPTAGDGVAEAQAVFDSVRAASELPNVGVVDDLVIAGHSQGGAAALISGEIVGDYAPEMSLVGVVALAPGSTFPTFVDALLATPQKGLVLIGAAGMRAGHPDVDLAASLTPAALTDLTRVESECVDQTVQRYQDVATEYVVTRLPGSVDEIAAILEGNAAGSLPIAVPVFLGQGGQDLQAQLDVSAQLLTLYCALGTDIELRTYADADHVGVIEASADDVLDFITASYAHEPGTRACP